ncbi:hypothetical protein INT44_005882 [Umbelopsis vinacea]|uniref:Uncharacterized protein n=1 Tax=Umbelopsis vinacea TaxID=44442 RepID=A0A8H7UEM6_9FUNG|nr:hypothetical protein INT44_005882 [Umbelopsis vinacea]
MVISLTNRILTRLHRTRAIRQSWKRLIAATNDLNAGNSLTGIQSRESSEYITALQHESELTYALETILSLSQEEKEYKALIAVILSTLDTRNPLSMAFLNHIIDRAALPSKATISSASEMILQKVQRSKKTPTETLTKENACILWCILAERFAGDLCFSLWSSEIGDELLAMLSSPTENSTVRLYALLALEKFALTGTIKTLILSRPVDIADVLRSVIRECQQKYYLTAPSLLNLKDEQHRQANTELMPLHYFNQFVRSHGLATEPFSTTPLSESVSQQAGSLQGVNDIVSRFQKWAWITSSNPSLPSVDLDGSTEKLKQKAGAKNDAALCLWTGYRQLEHCSWWSLSYTFDATSRWKMGSCGLELRNDHPNFESVRATANVKVGKWYYEVLALTDGIMQIGWATERCHFVPEEGLGVGDDNAYPPNFLPLKERLWIRLLSKYNLGKILYVAHKANGTAVYPPTTSIPQCKPGDVIGTYLDLDNGLCTFFINGKDYGLTVEFDQPRKQAFETNKARRQKYGKTGQTVKDVEGLGLYPAISLTSHQHVIVNFGQSPWMYPPSLPEGGFQPMNACETMPEELKRNILKLTRLRGRKCTRVPISSLGRKAAELSGRAAWLDSDSDTETMSSNEEKEQTFCTICYSEPHCIQLQPCGHDGFCITCAKILSTCPLCRSTITKRRVVEPAQLSSPNASSSTLSVSSASSSGTNEPVTPIFSLPKATLSSLHLTLNTIEEMHERFG